MTSHLPAEDALIYAMVMMSAVDRAMSAGELEQIGGLLRTLPVFADFKTERLVTVAEDCAVLLAGPEGLDIALELMREALPPRLRETAYALAVEIAVVDGRIRSEEIRLLKLISDRLDLDRLVCAAIERGALARYRR